MQELYHRGDRAGNLGPTLCYGLRHVGLHELLDEALANNALSTHMFCIIPLQDVQERLAAELCHADELLVVA